MAAGADGLWALLADVDEWASRRGPRLDLVLMGGGALVLAHGSGRSTKDLDIVVRGSAEIEALRPLDMDPGPERRGKYGFRYHTSMLRFAD